MGRTDYFNDPAAPAANSLVVAVVVVVVNEDRVLMIQRSDNGRWSLPGGGQEIGESVREAAIRETREETGIYIKITGIIGIYSDPRHIIAYDNGEIRQEFAICLRARPVSGELRCSNESRQVKWVTESESDKLDASAATLRRLRHAFTMTDCYID